MYAASIALFETDQTLDMSVIANGIFNETSESSASKFTFQEYNNNSENNITQLINDTEDSENMFDSVDKSRIYIIYVYCTIFAIGLVGNVWVFFLVAKNKQAKAVTNIFIVNLAVADLFLMLFIPLIVVHSIIQEWVFGMFMCKLYFTCDGIYKFASITFIVLLSVDRYLAVCHPLSSRSVRTMRVALVMVAGGWTLVVLLMLPVILHATELLNQHENRSTVQCAIYWSPEYESSERARRTFTFCTFFITYLVPLLLVWTFYMLILHRLRRQDLLFTASGSRPRASTISLGSAGTTGTTTRPSTTLTRRRRSSRRISIMVLSIVIAYTLCWLPYWFVQLTYDLYPELTYTPYFTSISLIAYACQMANSAINPFLYAFGTGVSRNSGENSSSETSHGFFWHYCPCFFRRRAGNSRMFGSGNNLTAGDQHLLDSRSSMTHLTNLHKDSAVAYQRQRKSKSVSSASATANLNMILKERSPPSPHHQLPVISDPLHVHTKLMSMANNEHSSDSCV